MSKQIRFVNMWPGHRLRVKLIALVNEQIFLWHVNVTNLLQIFCSDRLKVISLLALELFYCCHVQSFFFARARVCVCVCVCEISFKFEFTAVAECVACLTSYRLLSWYYLVCGVSAWLKNPFHL